MNGDHAGVLTLAERAELEERLAEHGRNREEGESWESIPAVILAERTASRGEHR